MNAHGTGQAVLRATSTKDVQVTIDCHPSSNPDDQGPVLSIESTTLKIEQNDPPAAGYWQQAMTVPAGQHTIALQNQSDVPAVCSVKTTNLTASQTCRGWSAWRSPNTSHTHLYVGTKASNWEPFPASGDHWGSWAKWGSIIDDKPMQRGWLLHNLEHGGVVLSYKCTSATQSADCRAARDNLVQLVQHLGATRFVVTPDPTQPEMYGVRAWRMAYTSDCFDAASAGAFIKANYRHGREDTDADVPIPFDPTGTNVPCRDLMAAPDSCN